MPGSVAPVTGFIYRDLGKGLSSAAALARFGKGGALMAGGGNISCNGSAAGVGNDTSTTEVTLFTVTLPPNTLDIVGRQVCLEAYGNVTATSATKTVKLYFGSTVLSTLTWTTTQTGMWALSAIVTKTGSNAQTAILWPDQIVAAALVARIPTIASPTETDTAGIVCKVTGQSSAATANLVTCNVFTVAGYN